MSQIMSSLHPIAGCLNSLLGGNPQVQLGRVLGDLIKQGTDLATMSNSELLHVLDRVRRFHARSGIPFDKDIKNHRDHTPISALPLQQSEVTLTPAA